MALLPIGPCRAIGPVAAGVSYPVYNAFITNVAFTVGAAMYFRYSVMKMVAMTRAKVIVTMLLSYVLPVCMITPTLSRKDYEYVMSVVLAEYPEIASYGPFGGVITTHIGYKKNTLILIIGSFVLPALIFYWRRLIVRRLDTIRSSLSEKTFTSSRMLV
ncbi:hypothetical protein OSTOST_12556, partial [Ostertagia ostertagi]